MAGRERIAVVVDGSGRRRWPRAAGIGLVVLLILFFLGGGWIFSGQIRGDALLVEATEPTYGILVAGVSDDTISFELPDDPSADLLSGETLGVRWEGGYGLSGTVLTRTEDRIAKEFTLVTGAPPGPGTAVDLDGFATPPDPADGGIAYREVAFEGPLGGLGAWMVDGDPSKWAIFVHGRAAPLREAIRTLPAFLDRGITCLIVEYRNDPGAPATDDHLATFGVTEWEDLAAAVDYARAAGAEDVVLVGYSMGGAVVMSYLYRAGEADPVRGAVLEAPALELGAMIDARAAETDLPLLPVRVPGVLTGFSKWMAAVRYGVDWGATDYLDERVDSLETPILVIHGTEDGDVPIRLSRELADRRPGLVRLEEFRGAGHVRAWNHEPERYEAVIGEFLDRVLP